MPPEPLIAAESVVRLFPQRGGLFARRQWLRAVDDVSVSVAAGETVAVVGESGSGKSTLGRMLLGLLPPSAGTIRFRGAPLATLRGDAWKAFRREVQVVFQDTGAALNPRRTVGHSVALPLRWNRGLRKSEAEARAAALLDQVGLPAAEFFARLPHALSGGQRQRVGIARALASGPSLVVADEPVSALDVSVRAQVLRLMRQLQAEHGLAYVFITHDLGVVRAIADRVLVMHRGCVVEVGTTDAVLGAPRHPYTQALLAATPQPRAATSQPAM
jgi:ABC-type glutathione transport system ATPase component